MNIAELVEKLNEIGVGSKYYSFDGQLIPDTIVLNTYHKIWEVFYYSERGNKDDIKVFNSESDACDYIYNQFQNLVIIYKKHGIKM